MSDKLSEDLKQAHVCGDFGRGLEGYWERASKLEANVGCQYCNRLLDATVYTGIYECLTCIEWFDDTGSTKQLQDKNRELESMVLALENILCDNIGCMPDYIREQVEAFRKDQNK